MVVRLRVKLGLFCAEVHYGIVLGVAFSYFIGYYKVALKTGSKIVLQNSPTMQCDTTPPQSYAEPPKAQLPVVDFCFYYSKVDPNLSQSVWVVQHFRP